MSQSKLNERAREIVMKELNVDMKKADELIISTQRTSTKRVVQKMDVRDREVDVDQLNICFTTLLQSIPLHGKLVDDCKLLWQLKAMLFSNMDSPRSKIYND